MPTKVYLQYKEPNQKKWRYASVIVPTEGMEIDELTELFEYGNIHNNFIKELVYYSTKGVLDVWDIIVIEPSIQTHSTFINLGDKPEIVLAAEEKLKIINAKLRKLKKEAKEAELIAKEHQAERFKLEVKLDIQTKENIRNFIRHYEVSEEIAKWCLDNWDLFLETQKYFKHTPEKIRALYAKHTETKVEETPESFEPIVKEKVTSEYIEVDGHKINPQLFRDYLIHRNQGVKTWQFDEFEAKRVILHQRLFKAFGGDRLKRSSKEGERIYNNIEKVLNNAQKCGCGGIINGYGRCDKCEKTLNIGVYLNNLKKLVKHGNG